MAGGLRSILINRPRWCWSLSSTRISQGIPGRLASCLRPPHGQRTCRGAPVAHALSLKCGDEACPRGTHVREAVCVLVQQCGGSETVSGMVRCADHAPGWQAGL
jgi:hypothetical protein